MPKVPLNTITSGYGTVDALNQNFDAIEAAFDNTLSRDGDTPNQMSANLDMNGFSIINQRNAITVEGFNWEGSWLTATSYQVGDTIQESGSAYICVVAHTSGAFAVDLAASRWQLVAQANLPTQTGNSSKYLTTNGTSASWDDIRYTPIGTGAVQRTVTSKVQESVSIKDFGAVGDGVSNDTAAVTSGAAQSPIFAPVGLYNTTFATPAVLPTGVQYGFGQIRTADGNKSAPNYAVISAAPSSFGNEDSILTAFNGDFSKCQKPMAHYIFGAGTAGQPSSGYLYRPEIMPNYTYLYNESGWNQSLSGNGGRTGISAYRVKAAQYGQGDLVCFNGSVFVTGTKAGSTNFLANPAGVLFNGDMQAGANGVYLNPYETICRDGGFDAACVGVVNNFERTVSTGAKSAVWLGYRAQNIGAASCDALFSAVGKWTTGIDFTMSSLNFGANQAAISLKANQRIYFNNSANASGNLDADWRSTVFNGDYLTFDSSGGFMHFVRNGQSRLQIGVGQVVVANSELAVNIGSGSNAIIRARQTGFGLPTGTISSASFDTSTVTLSQLAQYVAALVQRIHSSTSGAHALIGP